MEAHKRLGNRWSDIARCIPGRSENSVKVHSPELSRLKLELLGVAGLQSCIHFCS